MPHHSFRCEDCNKYVHLTHARLDNIDKCDQCRHIENGTIPVADLQAVIAELEIIRSEQRQAVTANLLNNHTHTVAYCKGTIDGLGTVLDRLTALLPQEDDAS